MSDYIFIILLCSAIRFSIAWAADRQTPIHKSESCSLSLGKEFVTPYLIKKGSYKPNWHLLLAVIKLGEEFIQLSAECEWIVQTCLWSRATHWLASVVIISILKSWHVLSFPTLLRPIIGCKPNVLPSVECPLSKLWDAYKMASYAILFQRKVTFTFRDIIACGSQVIIQGYQTHIFLYLNSFLSIYFAQIIFQKLFSFWVLE